jgi:hypothetical protein
MQADLSTTNKEGRSLEQTIVDSFELLSTTLSENIQYALDESQLKIDSGEINWYKSLGNVLTKLVDYHHIPKEYIQKYTVYHYLDTLSFAQQIVFLQILLKESRKPKNKAERIAKQYFEEKRVDAGATEGNTDASKVVLMLANQKYGLYIQDHPDSIHWTPLPDVDYSKYISGLKRFIINNDDRAKYNDIIGFMSPFKEGDVVFKIKDLRDKRNNRGVQCRTADRQDIFVRLNTLLTEPVYNDEFIRQKISVVTQLADNKQIVKMVDNGIYKSGLCVIVEILLRYYQDTKHQNRIWFFDTDRAAINKVVEFKRT